MLRPLAAADRRERLSGSAQGERAARRRTKSPRRCPWWSRRRCRSLWTCRCSRCRSKHKGQLRAQGARAERLVGSVNVVGSRNVSELRGAQRGRNNRSVAPPTHRRSQRRRTLTSGHRYRPCRPRCQSRNIRRRCKGNPTHQRHAVSRADALAAHGGSRQARKAARLRTRRAAQGERAARRRTKSPRRCQRWF